MRALSIKIFGAILIATAANYSQADDLCVKPETHFFSCQTDNKKWIALCGVLPKNLQYRFGRLQQVEFRYPESTADNLDNFRFAHYARFQTERSEVVFSHAGVDYTVFDYTEQRMRRAGVRVTLANGKEREWICSGTVVSQLDKLRDALHCDADSALNGGDCR